MLFNLYFLLAGLLLLLMALARGTMQRLPFSTAMLYLLAGFLLGPAVLGVVYIDLVRQAHLMERITEIAVLISLFTAGLKLSPPIHDSRWRIPLRLATLSMWITVGLITLVGVWLLELPLGAAVLLGAILAPTDPVLAADVQVTRVGDRDKLRFGLTGEAGLNDGTAFPFVMLGLGLLGLHEMGQMGWRWLLVDVLWATFAGIGIGWICGVAVGRLVLFLRTRHHEALGLDEFIGLGLIALSYGAALLCLGYGFLAVFAAGLSLRRIERTVSGENAPMDVVAVGSEEKLEEVASDPKLAPAYMANALLGFNEQLEHLGEFLVVVLVGAMLSVVVHDAYVHAPHLLSAVAVLVPVLFFLIRPLSVAVGLAGNPMRRLQQSMLGWFGIRGIGSIYYLSYAISHGLPDDLARTLVTITLLVVAASIVLHGTSVTPLMNHYGRLMGRRQERRQQRRGV